jgi:hypothetical protein
VAGTVIKAPEAGQIEQILRQAGMGCAAVANHPLGTQAHPPGTD